ncbi:MAG TPA: response regulator [Planctomycetota bacterium]|nr:response regulator [Planctomycetota bacterium]
MAKDPYKYFRIEARELLDSLSKGVLELEKGAASKELAGKVLRYAHTLKGASRVVRQPEIGELAHKIEEVLAPFREGGQQVPRDAIGQMLALLDTIGVKLNALTAEPASEAGAMDLAPNRRSSDAPASTRPAAPAAIPPLLRRATDERFDTVRVEIKDMDSLLEGIARVELQISALRGQINNVERANELAETLAEQLASHHQSAARELDSGYHAPVKLGVLAEQLRDQLKLLRREFSASADQARVELSQVRGHSNELRLMPASSIFGQLERAVRDAAASQQKDVRFQASGGETRLDAHVLAALRDALLHVVRNAVAHGIESESARAEKNKPREGSITLDVERRGNRVAFICNDDGSGVDVEAVRAAARARKLLSPGEIDALDTERATQLILRGGITTMLNVTELAGRGVGHDVVRATIAGLKGTVAMSSRPGRGTRVELCVPISLASLAALTVEAGGTTVSVPLDAVRETLRLSEGDIARSADGLSIAHQGEVIPFLPLAGAMGISAGRASEPVRFSLPKQDGPGGPSYEAKARSPHSIALLVESAPHVVAIGVSRVCGTSSIVVRPLPLDAGAAPLVAGVFLDSEGVPQLLLDPRGLVEAARAGTVQDRAANVVERKPVLVIDDSLTTRMLEHSILASAGYEVELACSAEEGLERARERVFGLFIVDVEMPGMDGFEFVTRTRADPVLSKIPAILVTSRNAPEDLARGKKAGASAYIVKGEFDQKNLLQTIGDLMQR